MEKKKYEQSKKLDNVCYDIRGPVMDEAMRMEARGANILKLNIGNPAPFGFYAPDEVILDMIYNLRNCEGYSDSRGLFSARKAIMQYCQLKGIPNVGINDIFTGNGVSELITLTMQGLLDDGDEILVPAPDYPLWTASITLAGGKAVHYLCDEQQDWYPDINDLRSKVTPRTKGIVVINPNNPTGAIYSKETIQAIADVLKEAEKEYGHPIYILSDEPYRELVYVDREVPYIPDFYDNTLIAYSWSKSLSLPGERIGYIAIPKKSDNSEEFFNAAVVANRVCGDTNAPSLMQLVVERCMDAQVDIPYYEKNAKDLYKIVTDAGFDALVPQGAFYLWIKSPVADEKELVAAAKEERILMVPGSAFACPGYVRLSFCISNETIQRSAESFANLGKKYFG